MRPRLALQACAPNAFPGLWSRAGSRSPSRRRGSTTATQMASGPASDGCASAAGALSAAGRHTLQLRLVARPSNARRAGEARAGVGAPTMSSPPCALSRPPRASTPRGGLRIGRAPERSGRRRLLRQLPRCPQRSRAGAGTARATTRLVGRVDHRGPSRRLRRPWSLAAGARLAPGGGGASLEHDGAAPLWRLPDGRCCRARRAVRDGPPARRRASKAAAAAQL